MLFLCLCIRLQDKEETGSRTDDVGNHVAGTSDNRRASGNRVRVDGASASASAGASVSACACACASACACGTDGLHATVALAGNGPAVIAMARSGGLRLAALVVAWRRRLGAVLSIAWGRKLAVVTLVVADKLLVAVITGAALVLALFAPADKLLVALVAVAVLPCALAVEAHNLLLEPAVIVTRRPLAVVALAKDEAAPVLVVAGFSVALGAVTDDALLLALARNLGGAVTAVAGNLLLVPLNRLCWTTGLGDLGHDVGRLAHRAIGDGGRAFGNGGNLGGGDGLGNSTASLSSLGTHVHGDGLHGSSAIATRVATSVATT